MLQGAGPGGTVGYDVVQRRGAGGGGSQQQRSSFVSPFREKSRSLTSHPLIPLKTPSSWKLTISWGG